MSWASPFIQGSYGVVKLAYNENDNTYYVSIHSPLPAPPLTKVKASFPELDFLEDFLCSCLILFLGCFILGVRKEVMFPL